MTIYKECWKDLMEGNRKARRGHEMSMVNWIKGHPKVYIKNKRVTEVDLKRIQCVRCRLTQ